MKTLIQRNTRVFCTYHGKEHRDAGTVTGVYATVLWDGAEAESSERYDVETQLIAVEDYYRAVEDYYRKQVLRLEERVRQLEARDNHADSLAPALCIQHHR